MTATADISFMLLIFFLVASSMDSDKGLPRQLPPPPDKQEVVELEVKQRNVMLIAIDGADQLTLNGEPVTTTVLEQRIMEFVANENDDPSLPEKSRREVHLLGLTEVSDRHVLSVQVDRSTSYDAYFQMQNAIVRAYNRLRSQLAERKFGHAWAKCSEEERQAVGLVYPQRISEQPPTGQEGGPQ